MTGLRKTHLQQETETLSLVAQPFPEIVRVTLSLFYQVRQIENFHFQRGIFSALG